MTMNGYRSPLLSASLLAFALITTTAWAQAPSGERVEAPPVPPGLDVPAGHVAYLAAHAWGTQNYVCLPSPSGPAWKFLGPQATLYTPAHGDRHRQVTTHFLAPNPFEGGVARPSWQHSLDSSHVWGRPVAASSDEAYVEAGAIPWLLVEIVGAAPGPTDGRRLARTTYIQRLRTSGGLAPHTDCEVGAVAMVPYSTDYVFYRARHK
jgi:hypothetical protein